MIIISYFFIENQKLYTFTLILIYIINKAKKILIKIKLIIILEVL